MTTSVRSLYSPSTTGTPNLGDLDFPAVVTSDRLWSGIHIEWSTDLLGFSDIRIVRKLRDFPYSAVDGVIVYEGPASIGFFDDTGTAGPATYYYVLWFRDGSSDPWVTKYWTRVWDVALGPNTMPEVLWNLLPSMYRRSVESRDSSTDLNVLLEYVVSPVIREIESLTQFFPKLLDVEETPGPYLRGIAKYVGLEPNLELTYTQQREEIKAAVSSYKSKGLKATIERMAHAISGVPTTVIDYNQHLLITNWADKTLFSSDPLLGYLYLHPGDTFFRTIDFGEGSFDTATYGVYLNIGDQLLNERTVRKLFRTLGNFSPCYTSMDLWAIKDVEVEDFDISATVTESWWTEIEIEASEAFVNPNLLYTNSGGSTTNDTDSNLLDVWPEDSGTFETST